MNVTQAKAVLSAMDELIGLKVQSIECMKKLRLHAIARIEAERMGIKAEDVKGYTYVLLRRDNRARPFKEPKRFLVIILNNDSTRETEVEI